MVFIDNRAGNFFNFNFNINLGGHQTNINSSGADSLRALGLLNSFFGGDGFGLQQGRGFERMVPGCGCLPSPEVGLSGAPAGKGLTQNPDGSITTAGGYRVVPEGQQAAWKIFGPEGNELTRVWGDPHVYEADGTKWDFTKSSDFVLPDGTRIHAQTSYDPSKGNGYSVTTGLEIMNGADRASISGIDTNRPQTTMHQDAYAFRAMHLASDPNRDSFHLAGDGRQNIHWIRERNGQMEGVVKHAPGKTIDAGGHKIFEQDVDRTLMASVAPHMQPPFGSRAWGNMMRSQLNDAQAKAWGQALGPMGAFPALQNAFAIHAGHINGAFQADMRELMFGGWGGCFPNYNSPMSALHGLIDLLRADSTWRQQFRFGQAGAHLC